MEKQLGGPDGARFAILVAESEPFLTKFGVQPFDKKVTIE